VSPVRLLLDEHLSPVVADGLRRRGIDALAVAASPLAGGTDPEIWAAALRERRTIVTFDVADFVALLDRSIRAGAPSPPLVLVDSRSLPPEDFAGLVDALAALSARLASGRADARGGLFLRRR
jgi:predicted nuclease of predicted toxin-antitoxin system